jgi:hypothetical protein
MSDIEIGNDRGSMANRGRPTGAAVQVNETDEREYMSDDSRKS